MAPPPRVKISDPAELADMQMRKRKEFEDNIRKNRSRMANWTKYAAWEETQKEYDRARLGERGKWSGRKRSDLKSNREVEKTERLSRTATSRIIGCRVKEKRIKENEGEEGGGIDVG